MPVLARDDADIFYEEAGSGPTIVWIPGTGLRGGTWREQVEHFRDRFHCVTVDLRGSGESGGADTRFAIPDLASDVAAVLEALDVGEATVIGLSLGSAVAQELALNRPGLVSRLVLVATWSSTAAEHHIRRHFESRLYALEHGPMDVYRQFSFWMSSPRLYDHEPARQAAVERKLEAESSGTAIGIAAHFRADLAHETRSRLPRIDCPCLVLYGADDLITLPWYNQTVAELIPNATIEVIAAAGHLVWLERPDEVNDHIDRFLTR